MTKVTDGKPKVVGSAPFRFLIKVGAIGLVLMLNHNLVNMCLVHALETLDGAVECGAGKNCVSAGDGAVFEVHSNMIFTSKPLF